jgi:hypothetical protein
MFMVQWCIAFSSYSKLGRMQRQLREKKTVRAHLKSVMAQDHQDLCRIFAESLPFKRNPTSMDLPWISHGSPMDLPWISQYFKLEIRGIVDRSTCESSRCHRTWCQKTSQEPLPCKALNLHTVDCILRFQVQSGFDML